MISRTKSSTLWFVGLLSLSLFSLVSALSFGAAEISLEQAFYAVIGDVQAAEPTDSVLPAEQAVATSAALAEQIIWQLRMPRTLLALIAGGGLGLAGLMLQTVTRNPLADPYLFGISSGATVGVVLFMTFAGSALATALGQSESWLSPLVNQLSLSFAAFIGALVAIAILLAVAGSAIGRQVESMLLAGVALSFLFSAITSVTLYFSDPQAISAVIFWTMGSFARAQWLQLILPSVLLLTTLAAVLLFRRQLSALLLGDESAITLGVNVAKFRLVMLLLSSLLTASLVAVCGGIGFVGLMIPHIVRLFVSQAQVIHPIAVCLLGGVFMVWVDVIARTLLSHQELPLGIITGLLGSGFFLSLMVVRYRRQSR
ncbi:FecCD family ABC transporter permease [Thalassotalea euphylliae]|uniref:Iron ABC transporter permease n=1 Tax=Thalassotalea euphylliae TaxID=1655234 RepID=A0A3E0UBV9_9GAMM|nr:iron ABC transporter permease [Thalassotalea euphylliae]REL34214.1 iron ABC transporter permease [Thalassotalea euphylliae]